MKLTSGEDWTRRALEELRRSGYRPSGWVCFLNASFARAREAREARPELHRQAARWSTTSVLAAGAARELADALGAPAPRRAPAVAWWTASAAMLDWHLGMLEDPRGEPRRLSLPDALTLLRVALVPFTSAAAPSSPLFVGLLAAAATTDLADGPLARRAGPTRLGRDLDPAADIAFLTAAASATQRARWLPGPAAALIALRSAAPVLTLAAAYFRDARRPPVQPFGDARWTSPLIYGGLAAAALRHRRLGTALVTGSSLGALASFAAGVPGRRDRHNARARGRAGAPPNRPRRRGVQTA